MARVSSLVRMSVLVWVFASACTSESPGDEEIGDTGESSTGEGESTAGETTTTDTDADAEQGTDETGSPLEYTYWRDAKAVIDRKCATCHQPNMVAPFSLQTYDEVLELAPILAGAIDSGVMPPWPPNAACNEYSASRALADDERELLLTWLADGAIEGDPADAPEDPEPPPPFEPDVDVTLPEPYTPTGSPDDYRCFVIDWPSEITEDQYVVAQQVTPDQTTMVHHVIIFVAGPDEADFYQGLDDAEPGAGYECFGGPGKLDWSARWLGAWVPGMERWVAPPGTGVRVEAGSKLIVQMHYNTSAVNPSPDQTRVAYQLAPAVDKPAEFIPILDYGWVLGSKQMTIPAGDPDATHEVTLARDDGILLYLMQGLGVSPNTTVDVWGAALHQHLLGTHSVLTVERSGDASDECLLQVDDWDFHWQGQYGLAEPVAFGSGDAIHLQCWWDNSAENQPLVDGVPKPSVDVGWGEGTFDEMCLGVLLIARQQ
ncbi:monooxygenase [Nannocystaceae bacterium ST9]